MNFPEELKYENIKKEMDKNNNKSNFIPNRSIFPHKSLEPIKFDLSQNNKIYTKEDLANYINSLPKTFEDWLKE